MRLQLLFAIRYLAGRRLRTLLTTLAIIFGVSLVFGMNLVLPTMMAALQTNIQGSEGSVDFTITNVSGEAFSLDATAGLMDLDGVRAVSSSLQRTINLPADFVDHDPQHPDRITAVTLVGVEPQAARSVRAYPIVSGRYLDDADGAAAVISQTLADAFSVKLGEFITLPSAGGMVRLDIIGILPGRLMPGNEDVWVNLPQAQSMIDLPGKVNLIELNVEAFAGEARRNEIQRRIQTQLGEHFQVGNPSAGDELFASMELGQIALNLFGALALFMGGFIIFNSFRTVVTERRRDIGMLRTMGATRKFILGIILVEGLLQGLAGSLIGLTLGYLLAFGVLKVAQIPMSQFINLSLGLPVLSTWLVLESILLGVGITLFAGLVPAYQASNVSPLAALRPSLANVEFERTTGRSFWVGLVILISTLAAIFSGEPSFIIPGGFLFLFGLVIVTPALVHPFTKIFGLIIGLIFARQGVGEIAQSNLIRQSSRVAVTVSASMIGLAVVVAAGGLTTSLTGTIGSLIQKSLGSDYLFVPPSIGLWGSNIGANERFASDLRQLDEVAAVSTFRFASSNSGGQAVSLIGIDPDEFQQVSGVHFITGDESAYQIIGGERAMIANSPFLIATGKRVGDTVDLLTANGLVSYRIVASATDLLNGKFTTAYISQQNLLVDFGSHEDVFIQLNLKKGVDRQKIGGKLLEMAKDYPQFKVISGHDYYSAILEQMKGAFIGIYVLFFILAIPSLIAMLNTLTIGVIERTREIGMVRAVGGTRKQIRAMILAEALILAAIGAAFGILGGLYLGYVFVTAIRIIFPMGYYFPQFGILAAIAIGLLFGALAAFIPARQAARMNVVDALRYE